MGHHIGGRQRPVGVDGMRLQVESRRHGIAVWREESIGTQPGRHSCPPV
jgi:hypothetical protein